MKIITRVIAVAAALATITSSAWAATNPSFVVTARDFDSMMAGAKRIQDATSAKDNGDFEKTFLEQAGAPDANGIDKSRPWHFAMWHRGTGPSMNVYFIPVTNFKEFKNGLKEGKDFRGRHNLNVIRKNGKYAVIFLQHQHSPELTDPWIKVALEWRKTAPKSIDSIWQVNILIENELRQFLKASLKGLKGMAEMQAKAGAGKQTTPTPFPMTALTEVFGLYFDIGILIVEGVNNFTIDIDVDDEQITIKDHLKPVASSELAKLLNPASPDLGRFSANLNGDAAMVFVGHMSGSKFLRDFMSRAMAISANMQGSQDASMAKQMQEFLDNMLPMHFAGSFDMGLGFRFVGTYEFPDAKNNDAYKTLARITEDMAKAQVGKNAIYSDYKRESKIRKVNGIPIERISLTLNTNSPLFKLPGQREAFGMIANDGAMTYEFGGKGKRVYYAMGAPIEEAITKTKNPAKLRVSIDKNTVIAARYNMLKFMKTWMRMSPIKVPAMTEALGAIDPKGTGIDLKANVDGNLDGEAIVPLKLITEFDKFVRTMTKARSKKAVPAQTN